jgi:hypothetical protein
MPLQPTPSAQSAEKTQPQIINQLSAEIKRAVKAENFEAAAKLRNKLIKTDPAAVDEAVKTGQLIENAMSAAIDKEHLAIWHELYDELTTEEKNCLFYSMKEYTLPEKRMLLKYGSLNNRLFFLEKGRVTVGLPQEENKFQVLAQLGRGDVLGEYTFATIALCSATAVTKTTVQMRCLEGLKAEEWEEKHPGLYDKVLEFCKQHGRIDLISQRKELEHHTHPRYPVRGHVKAILLDKGGQQTKVSFNGELEEISRSGSSVSVHSNKKANVKQLLTRSFALSFTCGEKGKKTSFSSIGRVVHVSSLLHNNYLLHIGFHTPLPEELVKQLVP